MTEQEQLSLDALWEERIAHDPRYAAVREGRDPSPRAPAARPAVPAVREALRRYPLAVRLVVACVHRGDPTGRQLGCVACGGMKTTPEYGCAAHGVCAPGRLAYLTGTKTVAPYCSTCKDYSPVGQLTVPAGWADRIVLINLDRRADRLKRFAAQADKIPELAGWVRVSAVDGHQATIPAHWRGGPGAYGCRESHLAVLEDAIADGVRVLCVFEDDAQFTPGFGAGLAALLHAAPADWEGLLLGYQDQVPPGEVSPGIRRTVNAQRTHAYVVRGRAAMEDLYRLWSQAETHIDHGWYVWQQARAVYQPDPVLCGQAAGRSDIVNRIDGERWWQGRR